MDVDMKIQGSEILIKALKTLQEKAEKEIGFKALAAGGRELIKIAREKAPKNTGKLRRSFGTKQNKKRINEITMSVGIKRGKQYAYYAHMIEFGTRAHTVKAVNKKALANTSGAGIQGVFGKEVNIPAIPAKPFLGPALEQGATQIVDAMKAVLAQELIKRGAL